jgi:hypothetical protein
MVGVVVDGQVRDSGRIPQTRNLRERVGDSRRSDSICPKGDRRSSAMWDLSGFKIPLPHMRGRGNRFPNPNSMTNDRPLFGQLRITTSQHIMREMPGVKMVLRLTLKRPRAVVNPVYIRTWCHELMGALNGISAVLCSIWMRHSVRIEVIDHGRRELSFRSAVIGRMDELRSTVTRKEQQSPFTIPTDG